MSTSLHRSAALALTLFVSAGLAVAAVEPATTDQPAEKPADKPAAPATNDKPAKPSGPGPIIASTGVLDRAKKVGDKAPDFKLPDAQGGEFDLKEARAKGPVIVTWFRGEWCPFCNKQLVGMQERLKDLEAAGATVVAISPQTMEHTEATVTKDSVTFHMLSDEGFKVGEAYGVRYEMPPAMKEQLKKYNLDLTKYNGGTPGQDGDELPLTATYIIDQEGTIKYAFLDPDYTKRASPDDLLKVLGDMKKK
ncbi:MAG: AhpC/TSA family protein [Phycisphaerales bacterium]|nr:AhpC/TSA family protein [Phycisphaerales bacterium]